LGCCQRARSFILLPRGALSRLLPSDAVCAPPHLTHYHSLTSVGGPLLPPRRMARRLPEDSCVPRCAHRSGTLRSSSPLPPRRTATRPAQNPACSHAVAHPHIRGGKWGREGRRVAAAAALVRPIGEKQAGSRTLSLTGPGELWSFVLLAHVAPLGRKVGRGTTPIRLRTKESLPGPESTGEDPRGLAPGARHSAAPSGSMPAVSLDQAVPGMGGQAR
jgi:hypothetical protein